jgi:hypothetical protein
MKRLRAFAAALDTRARGRPSTGEVAHFAEVALMQAYRESRGLTEKDVFSLKKALEHLRVAAASELRLMYQRGG